RQILYTRAGRLSRKTLRSREKSAVRFFSGLGTLGGLFRLHRAGLGAGEGGVGTRGVELEVHVHVGVYAVYAARKGKLPDRGLVVEIRGRAGGADPEGEVCQTAQVVIVVGDVAVEVDAGGVARVLYHLAEDKGGGGELL